MSSESHADLIYRELPALLLLYADIFDVDERGAKDRLRNEEGLRSSINRPRTFAHYGNADIALQAAALAHGIAEGQHFLEGNKRDALVAIPPFLPLNRSFSHPSHMKNA